MVFDSKIQHLKLHFGIENIEDWNRVRPEWIIGKDGYGPAILDHIRLYLAAKNVTLADDMTPEFWKQNMNVSRIGHNMSDYDVCVPVPFTILVDKMEQQPFGFDGITADSVDIPTDIRKQIDIGLVDKKDVKLLVPKKYKALGAGMGDYSVDGFEGSVHIERKSQADAISTILGWDKRRERFERELETLSSIDYAAVVVESSFGEMLSAATQRGKKTAQENRKILHRQTLSWQQTYRVPWHFCDSRRLAEITAFRILQRFWKKRNQ